MIGERLRTAVAATGLVSAAALAIAGAALLHPSAALGAPSDQTGPALVLSGDPPGTVHTLQPGVPALWNVGVTVHRMPVSTLVGIVTSAGGFEAADIGVGSTVQVLGCTTAWTGATCASGERTILPSTATDQLPSAKLPLADPAKPIPAQTWVQARVTLAADAPTGTAGDLQVRLTVDASGGDQVPTAPATASGSTPLADTGSAPLGAGLLALAAVGGGLAASALVRRRRRG
ncbi:hypothetical protein [Humibacter albus]|uniref:hypothetical protein n=1 Tax=Humibacter albus TaxID=427754 RepID=UPI0003B4C0BB|nr:hypothetical protein [Humibacter albus]